MVKVTASLLAISAALTPALAVVRVMPLGDSVTAGVRIQNFLAPQLFKGTQSA
jgi:hypothetical protein